MKCTLTFTANGKAQTMSYNSSLPGSNIIDSELLGVLKLRENSLTWSDIVSDITEALLRLTVVKQTTTLLLLQKKDGLIGNCDIPYLLKEFPDLDFPTLDEPASILLLDSFNASTLPSNRVITSLGKELYVINKDESVVKALASHLKFKANLKNFKFDENGEDFLLLDSIRKAKKKKSIEELLINFSENHKNYKTGAITRNGRTISIYSFLDEITRKIRDIGLRIDYNNDFVNDINKRVRYYTTDKGTLKITLDVSSAFSIISTHYPEIIKALGVNTAAEFDSLMRNKVKDIEGKLSNIIPISTLNNYETGWEAFFNEYLNKKVSDSEPPLRYGFNKVEGSIILFSRKYRTLNDVGVTFETINALEPTRINYKGYKIYLLFDSDKKVTKYYVTKHHATENSGLKAFDSELEALAYIDDIAVKQDIAQNSLVALLYRRLQIDDDGNEIPGAYNNTLFNSSFLAFEYIPLGTVIEVKDVPFNSKTSLIVEEANLIHNSGSTLADFQKLVKNWNISESIKQRVLDEIQSPLEIAILLYKIAENVGDLKTDESVETALNIIKNASTIKYYIKNVLGYNRNKGGFNRFYEYEIIKIKDDLLFNEYRSNKSYPVLALFDAINLVFSDLFGVEAHILTVDEIIELFKDTEVDPNTDKAFISNGEIYINSTIASGEDLLHEYTHLFLGIIKADSLLRERYDLLLSLVLDTNEGTNELKAVKNAYPDRSGIDLAEEVVARLFGKYLAGKIDSDVTNIFRENTNWVSSKMESIFGNWTKTLSLQSLYGKSLVAVFNHFNHDISLLLKGGTTDLFSKTKTYRLLGNYIDREIKAGNIVEDCVGI